MCRLIGHGPRPMELGRTNDITNVVINNFGNMGGGTNMPPVVAFADKPCSDFCELGGRPPMGPEGRPPMGPEGHCCCGDHELADFGNSAMGKGIGKAAKYNGIANIIMAALGGGGNFLQGLFGGQGIWGYQNA